jgi:sec-independent protein translocase protein TatB
MEIFNVHLLELVLIAGLALVVFGPERLPEIGRMAGKQVARFLAWQQQSPELQMVNEMRAEFEKEIAELRDELTRTRNQMDISQSGKALTEQLKLSAGEAKAVVEQAAAPVIRPPIQTPVPAAVGRDVRSPALQPKAVSTPVVETALEDEQPVVDAAPLSDQPVVDAAPVEQPVVDAAPFEQPVADAAPFEQPVADAAPVEQPVVDAVPLSNGPVADVAPVVEAAAVATPPTAPDVELTARVVRIAADLQQLVLELQQRGLLEPEWQTAVGRAEEQTTP